MRKIKLTTAIIFFSISAFSQQKDTAIQITMLLKDYRILRQAIDVNIDSKKNSKDILDFMDMRVALLPPDTTTQKKPIPKKK